MSNPSLEKIIQEWPELTYAGFFVPDLREPGEGAAAARERHRARMLEPEALEEFDRAVSFIAGNLEPGARINNDASSYDLKHRAEDWHHANGTPAYISNGMFIAAMLNQLYRARITGINCKFNVSPVSMKRLRHVHTG